MEELDLSGNHRTTLPKSFAGMKKLNYLDLSYCDFVMLPSVFGSLPALEVLRLEDVMLLHGSATVIVRKSTTAVLSYWRARKDVL